MVYIGKILIVLDIYGWRRPRIYSTLYRSHEYLYAFDHIKVSPGHSSDAKHAHICYGFFNFIRLTVIFCYPAPRRAYEIPRWFSSTRDVIVRASIPVGIRNSKFLFLKAIRAVCVRVCACWWRGVMSVCLCVMPA